MQMIRYTYCAYYDGTPTASDSLRSTKSDEEIQELLEALPSRLEYHCAADAKIEAGDVEAREVRGSLRLTQTVTISTADQREAIDRIELAFKDVELFGERVS